jgi:hypothetical protein
MRRNAFWAEVKDWLGVAALAVGVMALLIGAGWITGGLVRPNASDIEFGLTYFGVLGALILAIAAFSYKGVGATGRDI